MNPAHLVALKDTGLQELRIEVCREFLEPLNTLSMGLSAFGTVSGGRKGLSMFAALVAQISESSQLLLKAEHAYSALSLIRQIIECEYLACAFAHDSAEVENWMSASEKYLKKFFMPASLRERYPDFFRQEDYSFHCATGGHPRFQAASSYLPCTMHAMEHSQYQLALVWADLAVHLRNLLKWQFRAVEAQGLASTPWFRIAAAKAKETCDKWDAMDPLSLGVQAPDEGTTTH